MILLSYDSYILAGIVLLQEHGAIADGTTRSTLTHTLHILYYTDMIYYYNLTSTGRRTRVLCVGIRYTKHYAMETIYIFERKFSLYTTTSKLLTESIFFDKSASLLVSLFVCLFVCSLTSPKRRTQVSGNFEG